MRGSERDDPRGMAAGRQHAFARLVDAHLAAQYRLATVILGDPSEAEDAVHDAVVNAWGRFGSLRELDRFDAWFGRILVNGCRDRLRSRKRHPVVDLSPSMGDRLARVLVAQDDVADTLLRDGLDRALIALDPDHRIIVVLRFWRDLPIDEIAIRMGLPAGTVKSRLHTAMQRLRAELERTGRDPG